MRNADIVRVVGDVVKCLNHGRFVVRLANGHEIVARVTVKRRSTLEIESSDRVEVSLSPADMSQGKIEKRI